MPWVGALVFEVGRLCAWFLFVGVDFVKIINKLGDLRLFVGGALGSHDSIEGDYMKGVICGSGFGLAGIKGKGNGSCVCVCLF